MSTAQIKALKEHDFSGQTGKILDIIIEHGPITGKQIAARMPAPKGKNEFPEGRVSARVIDNLIPTGCLIVTENKDGKNQYTYDHHKSNWASRAKDYNDFKYSDGILKFMVKYDQDLDESTTHLLLNMYHRIRAKQ
ncbi:MAG: hypothetical protein AAFU03_06735 [Bacteroidota bacterium]